MSAAAPQLEPEPEDTLAPAPSDLPGVGTMFGLVPGTVPRGVGPGLSFSLVAHVLVVAVVVVVPLLTPDASPEPRAGNRIMIYNPPPPPPPAGGGARVATAAPHPVVPPAHPTAFVAPVEEPTSLPPVSDLEASASTAVTDGMPDGEEGGVPGGVPGGRQGGVPGGTGDDPVLDFDSAPRLLKSTRPHYPSEAFVKRVEGTVILEILIDATGRVTRATVKRSVPLLDEAAVQTVREWIFAPAVKGGHPVATLATAPVTFMIH